MNVVPVVTDRSVDVDCSVLLNDSVGAVEVTEDV
jgi:hypothetical protein